MKRGVGSLKNQYGPLTTIDCYGDGDTVRGFQNGFVAEDTQMTSKDQVLGRDNQARFSAWGPMVGSNQPGSVIGRGWETKIASSEELAWQLAVPLVFGDETSCNTDRQYA